MSTAALEFLQQNAPDGNLTAEQAVQLLELSQQGDTGTQLPETGGVPDTATANDQAASELQGNDESSLDNLTADNAVVLAKDGVHTIPFERLQQTREENRELKGQVADFQTKYESAQQELETLRAHAQQRADAGVAPTDADRQVAAYDAAVEAGLDPDELMGDFSAEAIVKAMARVADGRVKAAVAEALKPFEGFLQQQREQQQSTADAAHDQAIYAAHPDLDSIAESKEFQAWMDQQVAAAPSFLKDSVRAGFEQVMGSGTAAEVIELFDSYKKAAGVSQAPAGRGPDLRAAAKQAIENAQPAVPASLSDFPGSAAGPADAFEVATQLSGPDLIGQMASWPPEKVQAFMNRRL